MHAGDARNHGASSSACLLVMRVVQLAAPTGTTLQVKQGHPSMLLP